MKVRGFEKVSLKEWEKEGYSYLYWNDIILPKRMTAHSAGYDIFSPIDFILNPGSEIKIPLGIKAYMLPDEFMMILPKSGLGFKFYTRLANTTGIGDSDYYNNPGNEGHYFAKIRNEGQQDIFIKQGDAILQAIFQKYLLVDGDDYTGENRVGGLGSTSKQ